VESRTNTVPRLLAASMHSPLSEKLLFRHDAASGLFGSDIEPLSDPPGKRYPACLLIAHVHLREPGMSLCRVQVRKWLAA